MLFIFYIHNRRKFNNYEAPELCSLRRQPRAVIPPFGSYPISVEQNLGRRSVCVCVWRHITSYFGSRKTLRRRPGWWYSDDQIPLAMSRPSAENANWRIAAINKQTNLAGALDAHILRWFCVVFYLICVGIIFLYFSYLLICMWVVAHRHWCPWAPFCCMSDQLALLTSAVSRRVQSDSAVGDDMCPEGCQPSAPWAEPVNTALINPRPAGELKTACGFREGKKTAPLRFHLPYLPSCAQLLWQFQSWLMQGQVTRSSRDSTRQIFNRATTTMLKGKLWNFRNMIRSSQPAKCISRIFCICDLRTSHFRNSIACMQGWWNSTIAWFNLSHSLVVFITNLNQIGNEVLRH